MNSDVATCFTAGLASALAAALVAYKYGGLSEHASEQQPSALPVAASLVFMLLLIGAIAVSPKRVPRRRRRIYVMRHGVKQENIPTRDNFTTELVADGLDGLAALADYLEAHQIRFATCLCSPFLRCRQTAAALVPRCTIEPGCSESLNDKCGLRDGSGGPGPIERVRSLVQAVVDEQQQKGDRPPLIGSHELVKDEQGSPPNAQCMQRAHTLARRLQATYTEEAAYPMLLVTHGCPCHGLVQSLLNGGSEVPRWESDKCPPMGAITVLEEAEEAGGAWRLVGSVLAVRDDADGGWEVRWRAGRACRGADPSKL